MQFIPEWAQKHPNMREVAVQESVYELVESKDSSPRNNLQP